MANGRAAWTARARLAFWVALLASVLSGVVVLSAAHGPAAVRYSAVATVLFERAGLTFGDVTPTERRIVEQIRLPRIAVAALVGAALAISGAALQGVFRNPLADPGLLGISSGAALGAVLALAFRLVNAIWVAPIAAFVGAIIAVGLVTLLATVSGRLSTSSLVLAGLAVQSFCSAGVAAVITSTGDPELVRNMLFWLVGGLESRSWLHAGILLPVAALGIVLMTAFGRDMNVLSQGDETAHSLGVNVQWTRIGLLGVSALLTATAVSVSGTIGYVGLVVPHLLRLLVGSDYRILLPVSAIGGALFLLSADTIARIAVQPVELRVGVVTALIGTPFFVLLMLRNQRSASAGL